MSSTIVLPLLILGGLLCVATALAAVVMSRRQAETTEPRCGKCGYNLTGAPANRCPECGMLFVEAGVITQQPRKHPSTRAIQIAVIMLVGFSLLGALGALTMAMRTRAARTQAVVNRQMALQSQAQARQAAQQAAVSENRTDDEPAETP